jgi:hypothetical protein
VRWKSEAKARTCDLLISGLAHASSAARHGTPAAAEQRCGGLEALARRADALQGRPPRLQLRPRAGARGARASFSDASLPLPWAVMLIPAGRPRLAL